MWIEFCVETYGPGNVLEGGMYFDTLKEATDFVAKYLEGHNFDKVTIARLEHKTEE